MRKPTRPKIGEGCHRGGRERNLHPAIPPGHWRQHAYKRETDATREAPCVDECNDQPEAGDGWAGRTGGTERPVVPSELGDVSGRRAHYASTAVCNVIGQE